MNNLIIITTNDGMHLIGEVEAPVHQRIIENGITSMDEIPMINPAMVLLLQAQQGLTLHIQPLYPWMPKGTIRIPSPSVKLYPLDSVPDDLEKSYRQIMTGIKIASPGDLGRLSVMPNN